MTIFSAARVSSFLARVLLLNYARRDERVTPSSTLSLVLRVPRHRHTP